ncbi:TonB-dependent receptor [Ideonella sp. DXS22W]|uniref:TonB-dependent receptor n=1 Tax=Pseudaquabacterium inlustre TaxID=2984192 RepID=A0ABU9CCI4_9BURK
MTTSIQRARHGRRAPVFQARPVAASCALLLLGASELAMAQQASQEVTVTGIRRGIESAISVKKNAESIVEAVSAEDIGKLPDNSIAESIARLPGLAAQRVAGRAQVISLRGMSPDFATTTLNGREMVSTGDNRSVEFDQYPSELLAAVLVHKTPTASLIGQGLSGTLDMQTVRPLNFASRAVAVGGRYSDNSLGSAANAKGSGNRFNFSYIDQFANRTVGVAIGFAHQETPIQENQVGLYEPWEVKDSNVTPGLPAATTSSGGIKALRRTGKTTRDGLMATVEVKPSAAWTSVVDLFHSKAKQEDTANQLEMNFNYNGAYPCNPACNWSNVSVVNGTLAGGTMTSAYPLVRGMYNKRDDTIDALGWNNRFKAGDATLTLDLSWSKAKRDELNLENNTQLVGTPVPYDTTTVRFRSNDFSTFALTRDYSNPATLFLRGTIYGSGYGKVPHVDDELKSFKLSGAMPAPKGLPLISDIEVGLNYADRQKNKTQPEANINVGAQGDTVIGSDLQYGLVNLGFAGLGSVPSWNVPGAVSRYMTFSPSSTAFPYLIAKAWSVSEKITTAFLKGNIDSEWAGFPVRGNVGVQLQRADQSSTGMRLVNNVAAPVADGKTYTDVLPSLNLAFDLGQEQTLRLGLAKQVARPRVDELRSSLDFGIDNATGKPGGSGGNAKLDPWRANALDLSYEKYFGNKAYVAVAGFYKDLRSYIYKQTISNYDYSGFIAGLVPANSCTVGGVTNQPCPPILATGNYTAPFNGSGGKLSGVEMSASLPLDKLTPALKGFGVVASMTFNHSNISIDLSQDGDNRGSLGKASIGLPGLSKRVSNLTAYYEANGFEVRVSQRRRSDFIGEIGDFAANRKLRYVVGENITDLQVGYSFAEGRFKGLSLTAQVNNLTDEAYQTYSGTRDRPLEYIKWGRSVLLGANYRF